MPVRRPRRSRSPAVAEPALAFCANCQVSVAAVELERGAAKRTPRGRVFCAICTRATPAERQARRRALEDEFADDAPIGSPQAPARPGQTRGAAQAVPRPPTLEQRVAHLEQVVLGLQARLRSLEADG